MDMMGVTEQGCCEVLALSVPRSSTQGLSTGFPDAHAEQRQPW